MLPKLNRARNGNEIAFRDGAGPKWVVRFVLGAIRNLVIEWAKFFGPVAIRLLGEIVNRKTKHLH
jgi:uncharacterized membrane protein YjjB (DUF3815 family)